MPIRLSVCSHEQLGSHWTDFNEISHLKILRKYIVNIQVDQNLTRTQDTLYEDVCTYIAEFFLE
jgi:hypothetical protein